MDEVLKRQAALELAVKFYGDTGGIEPKDIVAAAGDFYAFMNGEQPKDENQQ